jgi:hypothetical protein
MTRLKHNPLVVQVVDGMPIAIIWEERRQSIVIHQQWVVDDRWWDERLYQTCYKVTTDSGLLVICEDHVHRQWYVQREYD